jgi:hypothetical protein
MSTFVDWLEVLRDAGDEPSHYQYVYLPNDSRLLLSKLVAGNRFLVPGRDSIYYGPSEQDELYRAALTAYNQLMNPFEISQIQPNELALHAAMSEIMTMPNLIAFWPMSAGYIDPSDASANLIIRDVSGNGWDLISANYPRLGYDASLEFASPRLVLDSANQQYAETQAAPHLAVGASYSTSEVAGLTIAGLINPNPGAANMEVLSKWGSSSVYRSFYVRINSAGDLGFLVYDGSNTDGTAVGLAEDEWSFFCARYKTAEFLELMVDGTSAVDANLSTFFVNTVAVEPTFIGSRRGVTNFYDGYLSMLWVSQSYIPDDRINHLRDLLLPMYGKEI